MSRVESVESKEWNNIYALIKQKNSLKNAIANQKMSTKRKNSLELRLLAVEDEIEEREDLVRRVL